MEHHHYNRNPKLPNKILKPFIPSSQGIPIKTAKQSLANPLITQSPNLPVPKSPSLPVPKSPSHPISKSPHHQVTKSPSPKVTQSPSLPVSKSPNQSTGVLKKIKQLLVKNLLQPRFFFNFDAVAITVAIPIPFLRIGIIN